MDDESLMISRSASPSVSPRHRPNPSLLGASDGIGQRSTAREAWGSQTRGVTTSRSTAGTPGRGPDTKGPPRPERRGSTSSSRGGRTGAAQTRRAESLPMDYSSTDWNCTTLFGGERVVDGKAKRPSAVVFRRPQSSRAPPHQRPIFMSGSDGQDPRMCVDIHAPQRFTSSERTRYEKSWCKTRPTACADDVGNRAPNAATVASLGDGGVFGGGRSSALGRRSVCSSVDRRSCTPSRPESAASMAFGSALAFGSSRGPSPTSGQRPPMCRPTSTTTHRGLATPTPPPLAWSGVAA